MYKKILAAIDFTENSEKVLGAAQKLAVDDPSKIHVIHVVQPITEGYALNIYTKNFQALEDEASEQATAQLAEYGSSHNVPADQLHSLVGDRAGEIRKTAKDIGADVIVIGSHGHTGEMKLLGATANKLLHGAKCDILTVHATDH